MVYPSTAREFIVHAEERFNESDLFYGHGTDNPHDEAVYLILRALALPFDAGSATLDAPLLRQQQVRLSRLVNRRIIERMPVAYLVNEAWFAGMPFYVDERVIIPRSPMAELIESGFSPWIETEKVSHILDLGTGSGCIAIACAHAFSTAHVDATDIDVEALLVAKRNVDHYRLAERIELINSNVFQNLPSRKYDVIVTNPPYVSTAEMQDLPAEFRHEPAVALAAGSDGLAVAREILQGAGGFLARDGIVVIEVGNSQSAVTDAYPELPFTWLEFEHGGEGVLLLTADELNLLNH